MHSAKQSHLKKKPVFVTCKYLFPRCNTSSQVFFGKAAHFAFKKDRTVNVIRVSPWKGQSKKKNIFQKQATVGDRGR